MTMTEQTIAVVDGDVLRFHLAQRLGQIRAAIQIAEAQPPRRQADVLWQKYLIYRRVLLIETSQDIAAPLPLPEGENQP